MAKAESMELEVQKAGGLERALAQGNVVLRAQGEMVQAIALARPREVEVVEKAIMAEINMLTPEEAATMYYRIPFKETTDDGEKQVFVEGTSIGAAKLMARLWGRCSSGTFILEEREDCFVVGGAAIDLETGYQFLQQKRVPKMKWSKRARRNVVVPSYALEKMIAAEQSKARRDALLGVLPTWLSNRVFAKSKAIATGKIITQDMPRALEGLRVGFERIGVDRKVLERYVLDKMKHPLEQVTAEELADLRSTGESIKAGEETVEGIFSDYFESDAETPPEGVAQDAWLVFMAAAKENGLDVGAARAFWDTCAAEKIPFEETIRRLREKKPAQQAPPPQTGGTKLTSGKFDYN